MSVQLGIDTGGTFTDVVLYDTSSGEVFTTKTPSTSPNFERGVLNGIDKILEETSYDASDVSFLSHGTTVGTNAVLEGNIPELGLITNDGLKDVLEIGDQTRPELYNLQVEKPPVLIPRNLRRGVPGRIDSEGNVVDPLDEEAAIEAIKDLIDADVESIVVSMLFSFLNDSHELRIGELIDEVDSTFDYALSSQAHPEIREYDRTITTVLNEAIKQRVSDYFSKLDSGIAERGIEAALNVMHSGGGIFGTTQATNRAIRTVLSGPAAGAISTQNVSKIEGYPNAVGMDMGGTSADVSIVRDGELVRTIEGEIKDLPFKNKMIDISTVGAGGGSIAWLDSGGGLRVGPKSAGADPGPVCYGNGGEDPTVTDANLILGRLDPDHFLKGEMSLAIERAREVFKEKIADPLDETVEASALSVLKVANASLAREIRRVTIERGNDPSEFALVAFGGAGPLQAPDVANQMNMNTVIVPNNPGVFSARGLLQADIRMDESHSYRKADIELNALRNQFEDLERQVLDRFEEQGVDPSDIRIQRVADVRYRGQAYELAVPVSATVDETEINAIEERFHEEHARIYGHAMRDEPISIITLRVAGLVESDPLRDKVKLADEDSYHGTREVYFEGHEFLTTEVYNRAAMEVEEEVSGPAVLHDAGSTLLIPPEMSASVTSHGNLVIRL